ncbi:glucose 1-dehydrogenase [Micromonospora gifhornensis]|uniref:SDR family NAD(P)-dependent oxidoreductase n=1 Tax=Micromonospora gifhornensis TaxID=84594 RepID=UPI003453331F
MRLAGKVCLISGGTAGIGLTTAELFARHDAQAVVVTGRDPERGAEAVERLGGNAWYLPQDVVDEDRWDAVVDAVVARYGRLDILVNNAGWIGDEQAQDIEEVELEQWRRILAVNLDSVMLGCRAAVRVMGANGGGSIVNVSSTAGLMSTPLFTAYGAAKAAITQLTKSVAVHCAWRRYGIRCNSVHPGLIETDLGDRVLALFDPDVDRARTAYLARVPMGELGTPDDAAAAILYLASDESRHVTGTQLVVSGGLGV